MPDSAVQEFSESLSRYTVSGKGTHVFNQGQPTRGLYFNCRGVVKLVRSLEKGEDVIVDLVVPCAVIGAAYLHEAKTTYLCSAASVTESTEIAYIRMSKMVSLMASSPQLGLGLVRHLSGKLRTAYKKVSILKLPVEERLRALAVDLYKLHIRQDSGDSIRIALSRQEISQWAQTTPETLCRIANCLAESGFLRIGEKGTMYLVKEVLDKYLSEDED